MRKLVARDIAPFTKILVKMEFREPLKAIFSKLRSTDETTNSTIILELIWGIVENYWKAEDEVYQFLAELEGKNPEDIAGLEIDEFIDLIKELFSSKNLSFFRSAVK